MFIIDVAFAGENWLVRSIVNKLLLHLVFVTVLGYNIFFLSV